MKSFYLLIEFTQHFIVPYFKGFSYRNRNIVHLYYEQNKAYIWHNHIQWRNNDFYLFVQLLESFLYIYDHEHFHVNIPFLIH